MRKGIEYVKSLPYKVEEYQSWLNDFDTREGYICTNVKIYDWLRSDDLDKIIKELEVSEEVEALILNEFDETRLDGIFQHQIEYEGECFRDWLHGCEHTNYHKQANLYEEFCRYQKEDCEVCYLNEERRLRNDAKSVEVWSRLRYWHKEFKELHDKGIAPDKYRAKLLKENAQEQQEYYWLKHIDCEGYFFGRSGGWLGIAKYDDLDMDHYDVTDLVSYIEEAENESSDYKFWKSLEENYGKREAIAQVEDILYRMEMNQNAVNFIVDYVQDAKKYVKEGAVERLREEVRSFIEEEFTLEEQINSGAFKCNSIKELTKESLLTNANARVPVEDVNKIIGLYHDNADVVGLTVGAYTINKVIKTSTDAIFKIGCHVFRLSDVESQLKTVRL